MAELASQNFGSLLRQLRLDAGLTQEELAQIAGISARSVSDLERDISLRPRKNTVSLLADALELQGSLREAFNAAAQGHVLPGGLAAHGGAATCTLPGDFGPLTGRERELRELTEAGPGGLAGIRAIGGMPGVGKTALAVHAAHMLRYRFPDRQLFIDLHAHTPGQDPTAPEAALAILLTAVGVEPRYLPEDMEARAGLWRDKMSSQRALLVLDNAVGSTQVIPLLPGGASCLVLVTSRRHLGDLPGAVVSIQVDALPPGQAEEMFVRLAPRAAAAPEAAVQELVRLAGGLPLAVSLLARIYARHPAWMLADLVRETSARLLTLAAENDSVAAAFDVSYGSLHSSEQRFFRRLGLHPGITIDAYAAATLAGIPLDEAAALLDVLHGEGLLTEPAYRRYNMHDLIRRYARDLAAADPASDRDQCLEALVDYYQHTAVTAEALLTRQPRTTPAAITSMPTRTVVPDLPDRASALAWARAERTNLLACLDQVTRAGQHARVVALTCAMAALMRQDGPWADAIARHGSAVQAARHLGDRPGLADALSNLGVAQWLTGDHTGAAETLQAALRIYRDLGNRLGQAGALHNLGTVRLLTGNYHGAAELLEAALDTYRDLSNRLGQANALSDLATVRGLIGDYPAAAETLEAALCIYRNLGDRLGEARSLNDLGAVRQQTEDYTGAAEALEAALGIHRSLGNRLGEGYALGNLGAVQRQIGNYQGAAEALEAALDICRGFGDRGGVAEVLNELGTLHRHRGDLDQSEACHRQALALALEINSSMDEANALAGLGRCTLAAGRTADAITNLRQAREIFHRIGAAEAMNVAAELDLLAGT